MVKQGGKIAEAASYELQKIAERAMKIREAIQREQL